MKFDLRYAFLVSAVIHAVFLQALGGALASRPQPVADAGSETLRLVFNLVDPVDFDPTRFADHTTRPDSLANDRGEGASATDGNETAARAASPGNSTDLAESADFRGIRRRGP